MKVKDTYNLLKQGNVEDAMNAILSEMDGTEKALDDEHIGEKEDVKPVEGKENTEAPKAEVSAVEKDLEAEHAAEGEEVGEVVVKEEEGKMPEATADKEPKEVCPDGDGSAVERDLEAEHTEEKKDVEPELVKEEDSAASAVEAELEKEHAHEDDDLEPVEVKEDAVSEDNLETNPEEGKEVELHTGEEPELEPEVKDELERQEELKAPEADLEPAEAEVFAEEKPEEDSGLLELYNLIDSINDSIDKLNEESVKGSLEDDHVAEDHELELADGKENTEAPKGDVAKIERDLEAEHVGEDDELELADGKENTEAPKGDVAEVERDLEVDHALEKAEAPEAVLVKEDISDDAELMGTGEEPKDKEYDADADIESSEMNGSDKKFDSYKEEKKDNEVEKPEAVKEACEKKKYTSIKEAYLLGKEYFGADSAITESAELKQAKLKEQLSMLAAREANDALYEAVIEHATALKNLKEAVLEKYSDKVTTIAETIINK